MSQEEKTGGSGSLRLVMPETAGIVDWLRAEFVALGLGAKAADSIVLKGKAGKGGFYAAEVGPDGEFREFGSTRDGSRCGVREGTITWQTPVTSDASSSAPLCRRGAAHGA